MSLPEGTVKIGFTPVCVVSYKWKNGYIKCSPSTLHVLTTQFLQAKDKKPTKVNCSIPYLITDRKEEWKNKKIKDILELAPVINMFLVMVPQFVY